jgi:3'-phosphoadenosine 5'-phosphosulfate sulfotransferase
MFIEMEIGKKYPVLIRKDKIDEVDINISEEGNYSLNINYTSYERKYSTQLYVSPDYDSVFAVYEAFKRAMGGEHVEIEGIGFIKPFV